MGTCSCINSETKHEMNIDLQRIKEISKIQL